MQKSDFFRVLHPCETQKSEAKRKLNKAKTKQKRSETAIIYASKRNEAKRKQNYSRFEAKKVYENEMKRKKRKRSENFKAKKDEVKFWDNL